MDHDAILSNCDVQLTPGASDVQAPRRTFAGLCRIRGSVRQTSAILSRYARLRLEAGDCNEAGKKTGARIIGTDRPGIGLSTWKKDYKLKDWPEDIADLCDHLNLQDVHVLGGSGGGIYAMACARYLGEKLRNQRRLKSSGILAGLLYDAGLSGVSWQRYIAYKYNMYAPRSLLKFTIDRELVRPAQDADPAVFRRTMVKLLESLPEIEQRCLRQDAESFDRLIDVFRESMTQGSEGYLTDAYLQFAPLPFPMESVRSRVKLYYGDSDGSTPLSMGEYAQERLPNANLKIFPGEGHFSLFFHHGTAIVADLIADD
ncbi:hypothetical protein L7F22_006403 [Adiantum nelumboides]|nr:hypothetical protein [Adiantum nelumboides]